MQNNPGKLTVDFTDNPVLAIFDCDGVLVDSEPIANRVLVQLLNEHGLNVKYEEAIQTFTGLSNDSFAELIRHKFNKVLSADFFEELRKRTFAVFETDLKAVHGVQEALKQISFAKCVASSGDYAKIKKSLSLTGLLSVFGANIFSASEVERGKPAPDLFLFAAQKMSMKPEQCYLVEDSIHGVKAGVAAGMTVIGYGESNTINLMQAGAKEVLTDMHELPMLLKRLLLSG